MLLTVGMLHTNTPNAHQSVMIRSNKRKSMSRTRKLDLIETGLIKAHVRSINFFLLSYSRFTDCVIIPLHHNYSIHNFVENILVIIVYSDIPLMVYGCYLYTAHLLNTWHLYRPSSGGTSITHFYSLITYKNGRDGLASAKIRQDLLETVSKTAVCSCFLLAMPSCVYIGPQMQRNGSENK